MISYISNFMIQSNIVGKTMKNVVVTKVSYMRVKTLAILNCGLMIIV
jgi:hypothetical protein